MTYIYASDKIWAVRAFIENRAKLNGDWLLVTSPKDLEKAIKQVTPAYIFFPHWSHIVQNNITDQFNCVCFHMTDLPFGRGGSPLQNLIKRGINKTKLTAIKMDENLDGGPVYMKSDLSLEGSAKEIYERMSNVAIDQIRSIVKDNPIPIPQPKTKNDYFIRRRPNESQMIDLSSLSEAYDHIRMLDAPGYPKAFLDNGIFRYIFSDARFSENADALIANVTITIRADGMNDDAI